LGLGKNQAWAQLPKEDGIDPGAASPGVKARRGAGGKGLDFRRVITLVRPPDEMAAASQGADNLRATGQQGHYAFLAHAKKSGARITPAPERKTAFCGGYLAAALAPAGTDGAAPPVSVGMRMQ